MAADVLTKCDFVNTEIDHDLNPPIGARLHKTEDFLRFSRNLLDNGPGGCNGIIDRGIIANPDERFKQDTVIAPYVIGSINDTSVLGHDNSVFHGLPEGQNWRITNLLRKTPDNTINSTRNPAIGGNIMRFSKRPAVGTGKATYPNLFPLFEPDQTDLFFIIDTGDNLLQYLKSYNSAPNRTIHQIHSMTTLADSAPKTLPDSKKYACSNPTVNLLSWYYPERITIRENDRLFMSNYNIQNSVRTVGWKINQEWRLGGPAGRFDYGTPDAKTDNSKELVKQVLIASGAPASFNYATPNINLEIQKKRSGDYLQIHYAESFPRLMSQAAERAKMVYVRGSAGIPFPTMNAAQYKRNTYFITGDWACFAYAIYNGVNSIIISGAVDPAQCIILRVNVN